MTDEKKPELKPLTPAEQAEFEKSRISDSVVQHKCDLCGAWYETNRGNVNFTESFICDCGSLMEFTVPALPAKITMPTNEDMLSLVDTDDRLDTGMTVKEAIKRAEAWWGKTGMREAQQQLKRQSEDVGGANKGAGSPFATMDQDDPNFMPSGIIHGQPWDSLTKREKLMITKTVHHFHVRVPDLLGSDQEATHKMQNRDTIN